MQLYCDSYLAVLKNNFMLIIMAFVLLIVTFFIWVGFPIFVIGIVVADITSNFVLTHIGVSLSVGLLFSLYFIPINLKVAKNIAVIKSRGPMNSFIRIEAVWILVGAFIFELIFSVIC
ncbi:hypothetical protein CFK37_19340 [Virgibacillus phasianinus]|uniref:Uncharacterized protein n=1 Tax=Virgibacillus phasianinus TaxID=2017483 RepID=A0A220U851_9BACI|nr:hypothetical protein [Virgibacillus phasianinus]ASK64152.1 hypothetical protein CFK37_19340 [Virgibacillus phasianinus]